MQSSRSQTQNDITLTNLRTGKNIIFSHNPDNDTGEIHYTLFTKMMPWDHAPGVLLFTEAGGLARTFDRQVYDPARRDTPGLLMAPDQASWEALHEVLLG